MENGGRKEENGWSQNSEEKMGGGARSAARLHRWSFEGFEVFEVCRVRRCAEEKKRPMGYLMRR